MTIWNAQVTVKLLMYMCANNHQNREGFDKVTAKIKRRNIRFTYVALKFADHSVPTTVFKCSVLAISNGFHREINASIS